MREKIHRPYYPNAAVKCACGNTFSVGSTRKELSVEICGACHPFYGSGKQRIIDAAGQVEKFRKRLDRVKATKAGRK